MKYWVILSDEEFIILIRIFHNSNIIHFIQVIKNIKNKIMLMIIRIKNSNLKTFNEKVRVKIILMNYLNFLKNLKICNLMPKNTRIGKILNQLKSNIKQSISKMNFQYIKIHKHLRKTNKIK